MAATRGTLPFESLGGNEHRAHERTLPACLASAAMGLLFIRQILVDERDRHAPLSDR
jgi:hypothetical protein